MSALGHEQTSRHVRVMSVIPLKADIHERGLHVCFVPIADIVSRALLCDLTRMLMSSTKPLSKPNKGRIKVQLGTSAAWLNAWALSGVGATRYEEVL